MSKKYHIKEISNSSIWDEFNKKLTYSLFVQSSSYIDFYKKTGENGWIVGIYDNQDTLIGGSVCVTVRAKRGSFLYLPYGPILLSEHNDEMKQIFSQFFMYLKKIAEKEQLSFIRVSPFIEDKQEFVDNFMQIGFRYAPMHILAENTWILDITENEDILMGNMKKNHRNLIRRCHKEGVTIKKSRTDDSLDLLDKLLDITSKRHNFTRFSKQYIEKEFNSFSKKNEAIIYEAYLPDGQLDSIAIIMQHGSMAAYRHSASLNIDNKIPTSYLLQWEVIKDAKKAGIKFYNFWGIAPSDATNKHPFYGITHFKKGFGGFSLDLIHCLDYPVKTTYWISWFIETLRRIKRGF